jgi:hypothetical protein
MAVGGGRAIKRKKPKRRVIKGRSSKRAPKKSAMVTKAEIPISAYSDLEDILAERLGKKPEFAGISRKALLLTDILYTSTHQIRDFAYSTAVALGRQIYAESDKSVGAVLNAIEASGLGGVLYYPFDDMAIITAKPLEPHLNIGSMVHVYEAGILAGYMTAATGSNIICYETHCIHNGSAICQFVLRQERRQLRRYRYELPESEVLIDRLVKVVMASPGGGRASGEYYLAHMLPIINKGTVENTSAVMHVAGMEFGRRIAALNHTTLEMIKDAFGADRIIVRWKKDIPERIDVHYPQISSRSEVMLLSKRFITGVLLSRYGKDISISTTEQHGNNYILNISLKRK